MAAWGRPHKNRRAHVIKKITLRFPSAAVQVAIRRRLLAAGWPAQPPAMPRTSAAAAVAGCVVSCGVGACMAVAATRRGLVQAAANDGPLPAIPDAQLAPQEYEDAESEDRLVRRIETVLQRRTSRITVVLERLCDGHNYAAVLRTCEAAGIQNVFLIAPPPEVSTDSAHALRCWSLVACAHLGPGYSVDSDFTLCRSVCGSKAPQ